MRKVFASIARFLKSNLYAYTLIYAPLVALIVLILLLIAYSKLREWGALSRETFDNPETIVFAIHCLIMAFLGFFAARKTVIGGYFKTYFALFLPLIVALAYVNIIYYQYVADKHLSPDDSALMYFFGFIAAIYTCFAIGFAIGAIGKKDAISLKKSTYISLAIALSALLIFAAQIIYVNKYTISSDLSDMQPVYGYEYIEETTALNKEPTIRFYDNLPKLDGATAFYPIYASAAKALYKKPDNLSEHSFKYDYFTSSATPWAYRRLIEGEVDLIFVLAPSDEQRKEALEAGAELTLTPIGKEAFVFLINEQNPVKSLTIEQIQKIYTGEITNWREVGGNDAKILAFQRNNNSGSQTTMENNVMKGLKLQKALEEEISDEMAGLIRSVADYRNADSAIGYSFRFFVTGMMKAEGVRLLAINGVEPTIENIQNGSYPL
ncbi:MAG: substrate-binding domain-containing protein, partial [Helicobacteraceae bacterium]|nr:substrate-binding domain-containing protein [Helicobacteraceae bacterium]